MSTQERQAQEHLQEQHSSQPDVTGACWCIRSAECHSSVEGGKWHTVAQMCHTDIMPCESLSARVCIAAPLPIPLPVGVYPGRQQVLACVSGSLPPAWAVWSGFQTPGSPWSLWPLWASEDWTGGWKILFLCSSDFQNRQIIFKNEI